MLKQFAQKVEDLRRLIENQRSASVSKSSPCGPQCLVAISGGMDSMCLLDLFSKVLPVSDFAVAHCNFSLRGEESDGDQALVEEYCAALGVRVFVKRFDTVGYAREKGISIEMAARELRYAWFDELCREHGFDVLSVAHNANDNAETLMLNLLRGTGLNGLHSMSEISGTLPVAVFRPLLEFTRKQIEGHVLANKVPYRHDSSNFTSDYKRNRIRNEVFPVFEKINPSFIRTLNREIGYFSEAGSIVEDWCRSQLPNVLLNHPEPSLCHPEPSSCHPERSEGSVTISTAALLATPHWRYLLYHILQPYGFNAQTLAAVEDLLLSDRTVSGKRFESQDYVLLTCRESLRVIPRNVVPAENDEKIMVVRSPGIYNFNGCRFEVEILDRTPDMPLKQPQGAIILDADALRFPFVCRRWRQGDWMVPFGMRGKKKISDIFADLKYDSLQKEASIIIVDTLTEGLAEQQHIAALLGARIDDRYKASSSTARLLRITILQ